MLNISIKSKLYGLLAVIIIIIIIMLIVSSFMTY